MAKVMNPLMSTEARGRVGGLVYNTWRGVRYVKQNTSPAQPRTRCVLEIRSTFAKFVRAWQALDVDKRQHWDDYADTHKATDWTNLARRLTGANWFVRCNVRLAWMEHATIDEPPSTPAPDAPASFAAANGIQQSIITWTPSGGTDKLADIFHSGPLSKGIYPKIQRARHKAFLIGEGGTATITGLTPGRHWFWCRMLDEDNGLQSTWVTDYADVTNA
jgi:hypothetical protein